MLIAVDFDNTCAEQGFPGVGQDVPLAAEVLRALSARGDRLVLWTSRGDRPLEQARLWCVRHDVALVAVNAHPSQDDVRKVAADLYIDDHALGCPVCRPPGFRHDVVDWAAVARMLGVSL